MLQKYRILDLDDFIILTRVSDGMKLSEIAKELQLTPPAISHRLKKYGQVWKGFSLTHNPSGSCVGKRNMNQVAIDVCAMAKKFVGVLGEV
jgi:predicted transcriptional regulator